MGSTSPSSQPSGPDGAALRTPEAPRWVVELAAAERASWASGDRGVEVRSAWSARRGLVSVRVPDALSMDADGFHDAVRTAYGTLRDAFGSTGTSHLIRVWNFIPGILEPLGGLEHRYMVFNAARHEAYAGWYGGSREFEVRVATASGVGHDGRDLLIHGLAAAEPGRPVENPRQVPSFRYSRRWGPRPPSFARATLAALEGGGTPVLLVGGTASVRGEETVHVGDLDRQLEETFRNLSTLVQVGRQRCGSDDDEAPEARLARYRHLRVYYRREEHRRPVSDAVRLAFRRADTVELARADLCRDELLVEIEGVADLAP